ncbi:hypothetical protein YPPY45_1757, partial [Yersinia pestis PY-45]
MRIGVRAKD